MKNGLILILLLASCMSLCAQDKVILKSGNVYDCKIDREDSTKLYITITVNRESHSTFIEKSKVQEIIYSNYFEEPAEGVIQILGKGRQRVFKQNSIYLTRMELKPILLHNKASSSKFKQAQFLQGTSFMLGMAGGIGLGNEIAHYVLQREFRWKRAGIAGGIVAIAYLFEGWAHDALGESVRLYNANQTALDNMGFDDLNLIPASIGFAFRF